MEFFAMPVAQPVVSHQSASVARWGARILSAPILLFWGFMLMAHLVGDAAEPSRPLTLNDSAQLCAMLLWLLSLALAWRWEFVAGGVTLTAALMGALLNPNTVTLAVIAAVPALLFLFCGWMTKPSRS